jgi:hypothetical protein
MPKFRIPVRWEMYGVKEVEAENIDEACDIVWNETKLCEINSEYVVGSFEVDSEMLENYNPKVN